MYRVGLSVSFVVTWRHSLVDTLGLVPGVLVTATHVPEREGVQGLLGRMLDW